uniref:BPTI/Kunitz inhibitor domain-containing protein n=1 Tax=Caenorhabditis tropicalis TaxID=1561998 RepID=A0A1I7U0W5_9PELO
MNVFRCKKFKVINCFGKNQNQFETYELCTRFCQSTACLAGQSLLLARDSSPVSCRDSGCPTGYRCVYDKLFNRHVCCGHSPTGVCPIGTVSFSHVRSNQPMRCTPSAYRDSCPPDFVCTTQGLHSFCCSPHDGNVNYNIVLIVDFAAICPAGQQPYTHIVSKHSMKCNPLETSSCPETYYCSPAVPGAHWGFCCSVHIEATCPVETEPYKDFLSSTPVRCTVGVTQCNVGYSCQSSQSGSLIGFCCTIPKLSYRPPSRSSNDENTQPDISNDYHFFIHNEGLIGPPVSPRTSQSVTSCHRKPGKKYQKVTKSTSTYGVASSYKPATCPPRATSVFYTNTQINVECTPAEGYSYNCPGWK